jgi:hypothetical protein
MEKSGKKRTQARFGMKMVVLLHTASSLISASAPFRKALDKPNGNDRVFALRPIFPSPPFALKMARGVAGGVRFLVLETVRSLRYPGAMRHPGAMHFAPKPICLVATEGSGSRTLSFGRRQVAVIAKLLGQTKDVAIRVRNFEFRQTIEHPFQSAMHDSVGYKLLIERAELTTFQT